MLPQGLVDVITFVVMAGLVVVVIKNPELLTAGIKLITDSLSDVLKLGG
jgi:hypothetical protein